MPPRASSPTTCLRNWAKRRGREHTVQDVSPSSMHYLSTLRLKVLDIDSEILIYIYIYILSLLQRHGASHERAGTGHVTVAASRSVTEAMQGHDWKRCSVQELDSKKQTNNINLPCQPPEWYYRYKQTDMCREIRRYAVRYRDKYHKCVKQ